MGRPGGLSNKPPAEVGNLIVGKEDTLFGRPSDPGKDISRDLVSSHHFWTLMLSSVLLLANLKNQQGCSDCDFAPVTECN